MINEVALTLLFALVGWKVALLYLALGLSIAIVAGWLGNRTAEYGEISGKLGAGYG